MFLVWCYMVYLKLNLSLLTRILNAYSKVPPKPKASSKRLYTTFLNSSINYIFSLLPLHPSIVACWIGKIAFWRFMLSSGKFLSSSYFWSLSISIKHSSALRFFLACLMQMRMCWPMSHNSHCFSQVVRLVLLNLDIFGPGQPIFIPK